MQIVFLASETQDEEITDLDLSKQIFQTELQNCEICQNRF